MQDTTLWRSCKMQPVEFNEWWLPSRPQALDDRWDEFMAVAVLVANTDYTAADLRRLMSKERDGQVVRRLSALALILEGHSRTVAAEQSGMDRQTLRDWVHRYNAGGVAALVSGKSTGRA